MNIPPNGSIRRYSSISCTCSVLERDAKLNELDDRATTLQQGAEMFDRNAGKIQRKMWYQNMKMNFIIGGVVLVVIIIIIVVIVTSTGGDDPKPPNDSSGPQSITGED